MAPLTSPPSQSYIHPTPSIPTTPSLLSRQNSFFTNPHPPRPVQSTPATPATASSRPAKRKARRQVHDDGDASEWLTRTASALTMSRLEEKGQSWLAQRESSTSLRDEDEIAAGGWYSANTSRQRSWNSLGGERKSRRGSAVGRSEGVGGMGWQGPDFVDERDEAEMRGVLGVEHEGGEEGEEDPPMVDEREMKRVVMGRIGGWVDWAVGWMDFRDGVEGEDVEGEDDEEDEGGLKGGLDVEEVKRRLGAKGRGNGDEVVEMRDGLILPPPPAGDQAGVLSDARWLLRIAGKLAV